jgi:hypothetical protein
MYPYNANGSCVLRVAQQFEKQSNSTVVITVVHDELGNIFGNLHSFFFDSLYLDPPTEKKVGQASWKHSGSAGKSKDSLYNLTKIVSNVVLVIQGAIKGSRA